MSIGAAVPSSQDRMMGRIARGGQDPAVEALRQRLAAQNAQTAMQIAASSPGVNPALANRNAQMGLAQSQVATNAELARAGMGSAQQARQSDPMGDARRRMLMAGGMFANNLTAGLASQQAGLNAGKPGVGKPEVGKVAGQAAPLSVQGIDKVTGLGAPAMVGSEVLDPYSVQALQQGAPAPAAEPPPVDHAPPLESQPAPPQDPGALQMQSGPAGGSGMTLGPAPGAAVAPVATPQLAERQITQRLAPQLATPAPPAVDPRSEVRIAPEADPSFAAPPVQAPQAQGPAPVDIPPEIASNPQNQGLMALYQEALASGDQRRIAALRTALMAFQGQ
jgi:hypothetical protein